MPYPQLGHRARDSTKSTVRKYVGTVSSRQDPCPPDAGLGFSRVNGLIDPNTIKSATRPIVDTQEPSIDTSSRSVSRNSHLRSAYEVSPGAP